MANDLLKHFPVILDVPVRWGDMDAFQHVNNIVYFQYFESGRIAYFEALQIDDFLSGRKVGPILASISCQFRFPVTYPDTLQVGTRVSQIGSDRFVMEHRAISTRHDRLVAESEGTGVSFDYAAQRKAPIPDAVRMRIMEMEATVGHTPAEMVSRR